MWGRFLFPMEKYSTGKFSLLHHWMLVARRTPFPYRKSDMGELSSSLLHAQPGLSSEKKMGREETGWLPPQAHSIPGATGDVKGCKSKAWGHYSKRVHYLAYSLIRAILTKNKIYNYIQNWKHETSRKPHRINGKKATRFYKISKPWPSQFLISHSFLHFQCSTVLSRDSGWFFSYRKYYVFLHWWFHHQYNIRHT